MHSTSIWGILGSYFGLFCGEEWVPKGPGVLLGVGQLPRGEGGVVGLARGAGGLQREVAHGRVSAGYAIWGIGWDWCGRYGAGMGERGPSSKPLAVRGTPLRIGEGGGGLWHG